MLYGTVHSGYRQTVRCLQKHDLPRTQWGLSEPQDPGAGESAPCRKWGITPNYMARGLRGVHNTVVGILSLGKGMFVNPSFRRVAGILDTLSENDCDLMIVHDLLAQEAPGYVPKYVRYLRQQRIQGLITLGWDDLPEVQQAANQFRTRGLWGRAPAGPARAFGCTGNYNYSSDLYRLL